VKLYRKNEIERRCLSLDPPIQSDRLSSLPSFKASIQIARPLDDRDWEQLRPRLEADLDTIEDGVRSETSRARTLNSSTPTITAQDDRKQEKERAKDAYERERKPIRDILTKLAEIIIKKDWLDGTKVNWGNCATFAVSVLEELRNRYYQGSYSGSLLLDDLKWIFSTKIANVTNALRGPRLFVCRDRCQPKVYTLEGAIQHHGSRHAELGPGNTSVDWKAVEWPEVLPFAADKTPFNARGNQSSYSKSGIDSLTGTPVATPIPLHNGPYSVPNPSPSFSRIGEVSSFPNGPFIPPTSHPEKFPGSRAYYPAPAAKERTATYFASPRPKHRLSDRPLTLVNDIHDPVPRTMRLSAVPPHANGGSSGANREKNIDESNVFTEAFHDAWNVMNGQQVDFRVYVCIKYSAHVFISQFGSEPDISLLFQVLSDTLPDVPFRELTSFQCKACAKYHRSVKGEPEPHQDKTLNLIDLAYHFDLVHKDPITVYSYSSEISRNIHPLWTEDMVLYPDDKAAQYLSNNALPTQDRHVREVLSIAFPRLMNEHLSRPTLAGHSNYRPEPLEGEEINYDDRYDRIAGSNANQRLNHHPLDPEHEALLSHEIESRIYAPMPPRQPPPHFTGPESNKREKYFYLVWHFPFT
jgi:hypothetical protein